MTVSKMDFADSEGGKSICDRRAAHIKSYVRRYVNEGNDVRTAVEFKDAIRHSGLKNMTVIVALPPSNENQNDVNSKIKNITTLKISFMTPMLYM